MRGWGRPKRDLPEVDYNESSSSDDDLALPANAFRSPLRSPQQPVHTREGSPQLLAHPTLCDNVDEVLEEVSVHLADHQQVLEEVEELTDLLEDINTKVEDPLGVESEEEVITFNFKVAADKDLAAENNEVDDEGEQNIIMPDAVVVNYDVENKNDGDKAADQARSVKVEFDASDIRFWFAQLEDEMVMASVGSQWLKKTILQRNLPVKQKEGGKNVD